MIDRRLAIVVMESYMQHMHRAELIGKIKALQPQLAAEGVSHIALFGSRARGDNKVTSDVDLLIDVDPARRFSLLNLVGVEQVIEEATGISEANRARAAGADDATH